MKTRIPTQKNNNIKHYIALCLLITSTLTFQAYGHENGVLNVPLPKFESCSSTEKPLLPSKWESGALLQHFSDTRLVTSNIVYDSAVSAMRFTMAGITKGSGDFLLLDDGKLYALSGGYHNPTQCRYIAPTALKVPDRQWLKQDSLCVGEAQVTEKDMVWWKYKVAPVSVETAQATFSHSAGNILRKTVKNSYDSTSQPPGADWIWYHKDSQLPYRTMFSIRNYDYGILGLFAFNYLPTFRAVEKTNLQEMKDMCSEQTVATDLAFNIDNVEDFLKDNILTNKQRMKLTNHWVPGLETTTSKLPPPPPWPHIAEITTFFTSVNYCYAPFPSRVYYNWKAQSQLTRMYWNDAGAIPPEPCSQTPEFFVQDALLRGDVSSSLNNTGFIFNKDQSGNPSQCHQVLPGIQVPNWKEVDNCEAKAQLAPGTILNPSNEIVKIIRCPITSFNAPVPQIFWTWYTITGTPIVFMQTNSNTDGTGLNLADYHFWKPGKPAPDGSFDLPNICRDQQKHPVPESCHSCHLPLKTM